MHLLLIFDFFVPDFGTFGALRETYYGYPCFFLVGTEIGLFPLDVAASSLLGLLVFLGNFELFVVIDDIAILVGVPTRGAAGVQTVPLQKQSVCLSQAVGF